MYTLTSVGVFFLGKNNMDKKLYLLSAEDVKPVTTEELLALPIEELLIIAKYMHVSNRMDLNKEELVEAILLRERLRAPYPNLDGDRFSYDPSSPVAKKYKIKKALEHLQYVLLSLID